MPLFWETPAEQEIGAMLAQERKEIREAEERYEEDTRIPCDHIQHILGGDCPNCHRSPEEIEAELAWEADRPFRERAYLNRWEEMTDESHLAPEDRCPF